MWGHKQTCVCLICRSFPRIFSLVADGRHYGGYQHFVGNWLRFLECEFRDELARSQGLPATPFPDSPVVPTTDPVGKGDTKREPSGFSAVPAPSGKGPQKGELNTTPKGKPPSPPPSVHEAPAANEIESNEEGTSKKDRSNSRKGHREGRERSRSRRRRESSHKRRRRSSRSRGRHQRRGEESPKRSRESRKEKKSRPDRPREPDNPPPSSTARSSQRPPEPRGPPPGRGWVGEVPYSDHPRWYSATNKGQVKRAKQERFNQKKKRYPRR